MISDLFVLEPPGNGRFKFCSKGYFTFCGKYAMMRVMSEVKTSRLPFSTTPRAPLPKASFRLIFNQIVLIFAIGCVFGAYYEEILCMVRTLWTTGDLEWVSRRGLVYGPFSPVYGIGAVGIYLVFYRNKANWPTCLIGGALLGGAFEYIASVVQEMVFGTRSWNYEGRLGDIGGRTTIPYMIFWGLLVVVAVQWLYPLLERGYDRLAGKRLNQLCVILAVFLAFDVTMSIAATIRQAQRRAGDEANNVLEVFLDDRFPDERLKLIYDNTVYVRE